jgi:hypothetical protein
VDIETICAKMRQVARLNKNGLKSEIDYQRQILAFRAQLDASLIISGMLDTAQALIMLGGLPRIVQAADTTDLRTLLQSLFTSVVLDPHMVTTAKACDLCRELLLKLDERVESTSRWAGWASRLRNEPFLTRLIKQLKALRRFRIAA